MIQNIKNFSSKLNNGFKPLINMCSQAASYQMNNFPIGNFAEYILYKTKQINKKTFQGTKI